MFDVYKEGKTWWGRILQTDSHKHTGTLYAQSYIILFFSQMLTIAQSINVSNLHKALAGFSLSLGAEYNLIWMGKPLYAKDLHCSQNALVCNFQDTSRKGAENCFQGCKADKIIVKVFVRALLE